MKKPFLFSISFIFLLMFYLKYKAILDHPYNIDMYE